MGLLTVDVTAHGVVMTSDTQPVQLLEGAIQVLPMNDRTKVKKIIERHAGGFDGLVGYVGTETIARATVRSVLERTINSTPTLPLDEFAGQVGRELSAAWQEHALRSCLWVFVAGVENHQPRFWFVVNGDLAPSGFYVNITNSFRVVNDLDMFAIPTAAARQGIPADQVLRRMTLFFRNGAIVPAAPVLDAFEPIVQTLYLGGYPGFPPIANIDAYAAIVRVRQEFVKRLFNKDKGVWRGDCQVR